MGCFGAEIGILDGLGLIDQLIGEGEGEGAGDSACVVSESEHISCFFRSPPEAHDGDLFG